MSQQTEKKSFNAILVIIVVAILAFLAYQFMYAPDNRTAGERVGDAVDNVKEGNLDGAVNSFEDKTPAEKLGDSVEKAGDKVQKSLDTDKK